MELSEEQERVRALAGELTMWTAAGAASGKVLTPSCARGKGGLTPSEGVRPQFCKARCSLYWDVVARWWFINLHRVPIPRRSRGVRIVGLSPL